MTVKEMLDDLSNKGKLEPNEYAALRLMLAYEQLEREKERFKKPTQKQLIEFAIVVNEGGLDDELLALMLTYSTMIVDRLYENGDILQASAQEILDGI